MTTDVQDLLKQALDIHQAGRLDEAQACYEQVLALEPSDHNALTNLGTVFLQRGQLAEGLDLIDRSLALRPNQPNALANKASALAAQGQLDQALAVLHNAPVLDQTGAAVAVQIGDVLREAGSKPQALDAYNLALRGRPDDLDILNRRAVVLVELRRFEGARAAFEAILALDPKHAAAWFNMAVASQKLLRFEDALDALEQARALGMDPATIDGSVGNALRELGRHDEALIAYGRSLAVRADAAVNGDRGIALMQMQRLDEAKAAFEAVLAAKPGDPYALSNLAAVHLTAGRGREGWRLFEERWKGSMSHTFQHLPRPLWFGETDVAGLTVLLLAEQGLGDTLQYVRYATLIAARGARVVLAVQPELVDLCRSVAGVVEVVRNDRPAPTFDVCCPLMSLPFACGTTEDSIPADAPYLFAPPHKARAWAGRLGPRTKKRVGLVWSGGVRPGVPEFWATNTRRNIPLSKLKPFSGIDVEFHSLQKGEAPEAELTMLKNSNWDGPKIADAVNELIDFSDTAALVENLDLVITVDTSTAHLAGALAKPVWILNRFDTCWRWMLGRADSPWYPTARLFRQPSPGDWESVIEEVRCALDAFASA